MAEEQEPSIAGDDARSKDEHEDVHSTITTGQLLASAMLQSGECLFDDPLTTNSNDGPRSEKGSVVEDDELLFQHVVPDEHRSLCTSSVQQSPQSQPQLSEQLEQGCSQVQKPANKVIPTTSDETVTLSTVNSDLPVPEVIYVFHKVKPRANSLRKLSKSMRIKMGFKQKVTLDEDDPEVYRETLIDL